MTTGAVKKSQKTKEQSALSKYYLVLYNVLQVIGLVWKFFWRIIEIYANSDRLELEKVIWK